MNTSHRANRVRSFRNDFSGPSPPFSFWVGVLDGSRRHRARGFFGRLLIIGGSLRDNGVVSVRYLRSLTIFVTTNANFFAVPSSSNQKKPRQGPSYGSYTTRTNMTTRAPLSYASISARAVSTSGANTVT